MKIGRLFSALCFIALLMSILHSVPFPDGTSSVDSPDVTIESLLKALEGETDEAARLEIIAQLANKYHHVDTDKAFHYVSEGIGLCKKTGNDKILSNLLNLKGTLYYRKGDYLNGRDCYQESLNIRRRLGDRKAIAASYNNLGIINRKLGDYAGALEFHKKSLDIATEMDDKPLIAATCNNIGNIYENQGSYHYAFDYFNRSLVISTQLGDKRRVAIAHNNIAIVYNYQGNFHGALQSYFNSLDIYEELDDKGGIASTSSNIGMVYSNLNNFHKALEYHVLSLEMGKKMENKKFISLGYVNIGHVYEMMRRYDEALENYFKSLELFKEMGDNRSAAINYNNIANIYQAKKEYKLALDNSLQCIEIANKYGFSGELVDGYQSMGALYIEMKNFNKAIDLLKKALTLSQQIDKPLFTKTIAQNLSTAYVGLGQYKEAYKYYVLFKETNDLMENAENVKKLTRLQLKYKYEKMQKQQELEQKKKNMEREAEIRREKMTKYALSGFAFLLLLLAFVVIRDNRLLGKQKKQIQVQNETLRQLNRFKEEMVGMIVHDLKNPINMIINYSDPKTGEYAAPVRQAGRVMLNLVMNMLDVQRFQNTQLFLKLAVENLKEVAHRALGEVEFLAREKNIALNCRVPDNLYVKMDPDKIKRVFVNLLTNAIKFTPNNGIVTIETQVMPDAETVKITVVDTGPGIPEENLLSVFEPYTQVSAKNSGAVGATGIGLTYCKLVVESHGGTIQARSNPEKGAVFSFTLSLADKTASAFGAQNDELNAEDGDSENGLRIIQLSDAEKEYLEPFIVQFSQLEVFELSQLLDLLAQVKAEKGSQLLKWKEGMRQTFFACNAEFYNELLALAKK